MSNLGTCAHCGQPIEDQHVCLNDQIAVEMDFIEALIDILVEESAPENKMMVKVLNLRFKKLLVLLDQREKRK